MGKGTRYHPLLLQLPEHPEGRTSSQQGRAFSEVFGVPRRVLLCSVIPISQGNKEQPRASANALGPRRSQAFCPQRWLRIGQTPGNVSGERLLGKGEFGSNP